ncbi:Transient receptor potential cation channel subfamily V member [Trichinella pseudospiralis]
MTNCSRIRIVHKPGRSARLSIGCARVTASPGEVWERPETDSGKLEACASALVDRAFCAAYSGGAERSSHAVKLILNEQTSSSTASRPEGPSRGRPKVAHAPVREGGVANPLQALTKKGEKWRWGLKKEEAFTSMKQALSGLPTTSDRIRTAGGSPLTCPRLFVRLRSQDSLPPTLPVDYRSRYQKTN